MNTASSLRVLLVEDSADDALLLLRELRGAGYKPVCRRVETAEQMASALREEPWEIVISDYLLPEFDGLQALRVLQQSGIDLPFIIVSGKVGEDVAVEAMRAGASDYITKDRLKRLGPAIERELRDADTRRERRMTEQALQESQEHYRLLAENVADVIWTLGLDLKFTYISPSVVKLRGFTVEESMAQPFEAMFTEESMQVIREKLQSIVTDGRIDPERELETRPIRLYMTCRDAPPVLTETVNSFLYDENGNVIGTLGVTRDISERQRMEEELERREARLKEVQQIAHIGNWEWSLADNLVICSEEVYRMFGLPLREYESPSTFLNAVHPDDRRLLSDTLDRAAYHGSHYRFDARIIMPNGSVRFLHHEGRAYPAETGKPGRVIGIVQDITDIRRAEEELRLLSRRLMEIQEEERHELARELHDEAGQSLTILRMLLSRARGLATDEEAGRTLDEAMKVTGELVEEVRNLSLSLRPGMLDQLGLVPTLEWYFKDFTARTDLYINFEHHGYAHRKAPAEIRVAAYRIIQESLTNIVRHASVDRAWVLLSINSDRLRIKVEDKGCGFDTSAVGPSSTGLRNIRERTRILGGHYRLRSAPGKGTRLEVILPFRRRVGPGHEGGIRQAAAVREP